MPIALGENVIIKVVLLFAATEVAGGEVTVKSDALVPLIVMVPMVNAIFPVLNIVNVLVVATELKSVQSAVVGVVSPSIIETVFPLMSIS